MSDRTTTAWGAVTLAVLGGVVAAVHVGKLPPALPPMRAELGFGLVAAGFVVALFNVLGMSLAALLGGMTERLGRGRLIGAGFAFMAAGGALGAVSEGLPLLLFSRLAEGVGFIAASVALPAMVIAATARRDQAVALGMWSVYTPLGMALAMLAAPFALSAVGWRGLWWAVALLCPLMAVAVLRALRRLELPAASDTPVWTLAKEAMRDRALLVNGLTFSAYAFQWMSVMVWLPTFQTEGLGADLRSASLATALIVLINVPGCLLGGWLVRRGAAPRLLILAGAAIMGLAMVGIFTDALADGARLGLCVVFSFFAGLIPPSLFNAVPRVAPSPRHVSAGNGMLMQGSAVGQFSGAPIVAFAVDSAGGDWSFALIPTLAACAVTLAAGAFVGVRRGG